MFLVINFQNTQLKSKESFILFAKTCFEPTRGILSFVNSLRLEWKQVDKSGRTKPLCKRAVKSLSFMTRHCLKPFCLILANNTSTTVNRARNVYKVKREEGRDVVNGRVLYWTLVYCHGPSEFHGLLLKTTYETSLS